MKLTKAVCTCGLIAFVVVVVVVNVRENQCTLTAGQNITYYHRLGSHYYSACSFLPG